MKIWPYPAVAPEIVEKYRPSLKKPKGSDWTLAADHPLLAKGGVCERLFEEVCEAVLDAHQDWEVYVKKYYIGFRSGGNLHMVVEGRSTNGGWLGIGLARPVDELADPEGMCADKTFGPGMPTRVDITDAGQIPALLDLCNQC